MGTGEGSRRRAGRGLVPTGCPGDVWLSVFPRRREVTADTSLQHLARVCGLAEGKEKENPCGPTRFPALGEVQVLEAPDPALSWDTRRPPGPYGSLGWICRLVSVPPVTPKPQVAKSHRSISAARGPAPGRRPHPYRGRGLHGGGLRRFGAGLWVRRFAVQRRESLYEVSKHPAGIRGLSKSRRDEVWL